MKNEAKERKQSVCDVMRDGGARASWHTHTGAGSSLSSPTHQQARRHSADIKAILQDENAWNLDIFALERVTEKRWAIWAVLVFAMLVVDEAVLSLLH